MNAVAFSLFGSAPLYCRGAISNAEQYPKFLPGWKVIIWLDASVPKEVQAKLRSLGAELRTPPPTLLNGMFWRFLIMDDPKIERFVVRDCDSRPLKREAEAIKAWLASGKPFHSMADHPHHTLPLGGGLWGLDKTKLKGEMPHLLSHVEEAIIKSRLAQKTYKRESSYSLDQTFLTRYVWPLARQFGVLRHDSCTRHLFEGAEPFPTGCKFGDERFVGEIVGADERPQNLHWQQRINFMSI